MFRIFSVGISFQLEHRPFSHRGLVDEGLA